jgi:hypothetical protein
MSDDIDDDKFTINRGDLRLVRRSDRVVPPGYDWKLADDGVTVYLYRDGEFAGTLDPE